MRRNHLFALSKKPELVIRPQCRRSDNRRGTEAQCRRSMTRMAQAARSSLMRTAPGSGTTSRTRERDQARANSAPNKRITEETYSQIMISARDPAAPKLVAAELCARQWRRCFFRLRRPSDSVWLRRLKAQLRTSPQNFWASAHLRGSRKTIQPLHRQ